MTLVVIPTIASIAGGVLFTVALFNRLFSRYSASCELVEEDS